MWYTGHMCASSPCTSQLYCLCTMVVILYGIHYACVFHVLACLILCMPVSECDSVYVLEQRKGAVVIRLALFSLKVKELFVPHLMRYT